ncbi:formamidopyrimidine-dna glycosylase [Heliomicrobium modesticaldum Ice1]|uniref:Formamidopyrimidine-DNA glycosylase n=1 Tax=Heliobacterium modesticaldum (strain ATCC 51547 / Ice1) TaxID=498761 RepID=FPG_HELMI|nr:DNA-formamidopyrimidine glycosylase [Heliomicrobium modesticaldum]B0TER7.1 RecName: Full=Formamidopyrimidine-DNA glycosylase; Short=Fapy-DNA glycosylase; AltName: Full=DNA-(apurinic or apyrimidinic site) lyase MutM; Short=AP lyase MutM [Heliomicrobium modesticaldum Ice1]ABZ84319.1 formamidopyrimidine-dna glycosylase [Heliomicrobium modesticaldum Ice1]
MPELPEVETVRRSLAGRITGLTIEKVELRLPKIAFALPGTLFTDALRGRRIIELGRRGKYLLLHLDGDETLVIHLRMTGRLIHLRPEEREEPEAAHTHAVFFLDDGSLLRYTDVRQFGTLTLMTREAALRQPGKGRLGPEPLGQDFSFVDFRNALVKRKTKLKPLLLDQSFLAGLGNIYADEALARARLHPDRTADSLDDEESRRLYDCIRTVLQEGIDAKGTSFRDYVDGEGRKGEFQEKLWVYGRGGNPCRRCGGEILREKRAGRSTHFCPRCQK